MDKLKKLVGLGLYGVDIGVQKLEDLTEEKGKEDGEKECLITSISKKVLLHIINSEITEDMFEKLSATS